MYRKVRIRLTILFSSVTIALLLALLAISFFWSAKSRYSLQLSGFSVQSASISEEAQALNVLTTEWMTSRETAASCYRFLMDQGVPVFHNSTQPREIQELFENISSVFPSGLKKVSDTPCAAGHIKKKQNQQQQKDTCSPVFSTFSHILPSLSKIFLFLLLYFSKV